MCSKAAAMEMAAQEIAISIAGRLQSRPKKAKWPFGVFSIAMESSGDGLPPCSAAVLRD